MCNWIFATTLSFFLLMHSLYAEEKTDVFLEQEIEQLSFYMGYLIGRDHSKNSYGFPTKFDKIVEGMKAGMSGEPVAGQEELVPLIKRMQKTIVEKQTELNLQDAENYLKHLVTEQPNLIEIEPSKLYYLVSKQGDGPIIHEHPLLHFKMSELKKGTLHLVYSTYCDKGEPLQVNLEEVIPGFLKGLKGMRIGEERLIYVHPDLAFGMGKLDIAPNRLIVFEVAACCSK